MNTQNVLVVPRPWTILMDREKDSVEFYVPFDLNMSDELMEVAVELFDASVGVNGFVLTRLVLPEVEGVAVHVQMLAPNEVTLDGVATVILIKMIRLLSSLETEARTGEDGVVDMNESILVAVTVGVEGVQIKVPPDIKLIHYSIKTDELIN